MPSDFSDADIEALRRSVARRIDTVITEAIQSIAAPPETTLRVEHLEDARQILLRNNPYGQNRHRRLSMVPRDRIMTTDEIERAVDALWETRPRLNPRRDLPMLTIKDDYEAPNWDTEAMAQWRPGQPEQEVSTETVFLNEQGLHLVVHRARQGGFSQFLVDDPDSTV